jgi:hypothetical protein
MALLGFGIVDVRIKRTLSLETEGHRSLLYGLRPMRDTLELAKGETVFSPDSWRSRDPGGDVRTSIQFDAHPRNPTEGYEPNKEEPLGHLKYIDEYEYEGKVQPSSVYLSAGLPPEDFQTLWLAALSGVLPMTFTFEIAGVSYGWEPNGRGKIWDNEKVPNPEIKELSWGLHISALSSRADS